MSRDTARTTACPIVFYGADGPVDDLIPILDQAHVEHRSTEGIESFAQLTDRPSVLLFDQSLLVQGFDLTQLPGHLVVIAADAAAEAWLGPQALSFCGMSDSATRLRVLHAGHRASEALRTAARCELELAALRGEVRELNRMGQSLMLERDPDVLLERILELAQRLTHSDAGALLLLEHGESRAPFLRIARVVCESIPDLPRIEGETSPVSADNIVGHCARTAKPLVIDNAHDLPAGSQFGLDPDFEQRHGYYLKSMLVLPMTDHRGKVVGVLLQANRKADPAARIFSKETADRFAMPYAPLDVEYGLSLAGQAAVSIENTRLYVQIEELFAGFVKAAALAIDQRDPTTAGHSTRVADLALELAVALERSPAGQRRKVRFDRRQMRELRYAALLHDFGKVGVSEEILVKSKKLPRFLWERVQARFELFRCLLEQQLECERAARTRGAGHQADELRSRLDDLEACLTEVRVANDSTRLTDGARLDLRGIARRSFQLADGRTIPFLTNEELRYLQIPHGNLDERERAEVESHAWQTFQFLSQIPWTDDLRDLPNYAGAHHEKLDGTGYPVGAAGVEIPIQTRIITIADIFDALTESDRPYRRAATADHALQILREEAEAGMLDGELVQVLAESQVYRRVLDLDWRDL